MRGSDAGRKKAGHATAKVLGPKGCTMRALAGGTEVLRKFGSEYFKALRAQRTNKQQEAVSR